MIKRTFLFFGILFAGVVLSAANPQKEIVASDSSKESLSLRFKFAKPFMFITFETEKREPLKIKFTSSAQYLNVQKMQYGDIMNQRKKNPKFMPPPPDFPDTVVTATPNSGVNLYYYLMPNFGYYDRRGANAKLDEWRKEYPDLDHTEFDWELRYVPLLDQVEYFIDGKYAGQIHNSGKLKKVVFMGPGIPEVKAKWFHSENQPGRYPLTSRDSHHVSPLFKSGAKLSLTSKPVGDDGTVVKPFPIENSLDSGLHNLRLGQQGLFTNRYNVRSAFDNIKENLLYSVPRRFYTHAWVLCTALPAEGKVPVLGVQITRMGGLGSAYLSASHVDLSDPATRKVVGQVTYPAAGGTKSLPVYLAKIPIDIGKILDIVNDKPIYFKDKLRLPSVLGGQFGPTRPDGPDYLDFEFCGTNAWDQRSSVQILGCTLVESPFAVEMVHFEHGNIFANDEKPETGVELIPRQDNTKGTLRYEILDAHFKSLKKADIPFTLLAKAGKPEVIKVPLNMPDVGWYELRYTFLNDRSEPVIHHRGSFALLGKDTREAGFDSPYSSWAWNGDYDAKTDEFPTRGRHNSNPDRATIAKTMYKAGYHSSWEPPVKSEAEMPDYKITCSMTNFVSRPYSDTAIVHGKTFEQRLDENVARVKDMRKRFPHLNTLMILHEPGGRDLAPEMLNWKAVTSKPGDPRYLKSWALAVEIINFTIRCCERARKEFPDMKIMIANGSSSSQMVAILFRGGLDAKMVDYLGIESKGFSSLPEESSNRESPAMAWALRETARRFGHDIPVNACNEYVFRPEREVTEEYLDYMGMTAYTLRDYLISLGHGVKCISSGHLEDSKTNYYDTNWGAGGQCKSFPYSYPKRVYVALATLTKVMDKPVFSRRLPTGELTCYALEFKRDRKVKDYAYAFWTPRFGVRLSVQFPVGTKVTRVRVFGNSEPVSLDKNGNTELTFAGTPTYLIASAPAISSRVVKHFTAEVNGEVKDLAPMTMSRVDVCKSYDLGNLDPLPGLFDCRDVNDPEKGKVIEAKLLPSDVPVPEVVTQYQLLKLKQPILLRRSEADRVGVWINGNSSWGKIEFQFDHGRRCLFSEPQRPFTTKVPNYLNFEGWQLIHADPFTLAGKDVQECYLTGIYIASARLALDPLEMRPVTKTLRIGNLVTVKMNTKEHPGKAKPEAVIDDKDL